MFVSAILNTYFSGGNLNYRQHNGPSIQESKLPVIAQKLFLELYQKRHRAANIGHLVIENAVIGLV